MGAEAKESKPLGAVDKSIKRATEQEFFARNTADEGSSARQQVLALLPSRRLAQALNKSPGLKGGILWNTDSNNNRVCQRADVLVWHDEMTADTLHVAPVGWMRDPRGRRSDGLDGQ